MTKNGIIAALVLALVVSIFIRMPLHDTVTPRQQGSRWEEAPGGAAPGGDPGADREEAEGGEEESGRGEGEPMALSQALKRAAEDPGLASGMMGFCLLETSGDILLGREPSVPMIPASTLKTLTVATGLEILGPDFTWETRLEGERHGSRIEKLVLRGGGDPTLAMTDLEKWAGELSDMGITRVGQVIGDGSFFSGETVGDFWGWGDVGNAYGSAASGLNLEHNRFTARLQPGASPGLAVRWLGAEPEVPGVEWRVSAVTGAPGSGDGTVIYGGPNATVMSIAGRVPAGTQVFETRGAVPNPPLFAAYHLDRLLRAIGITVETIPAAGRESQREVVLTKRSDPLRDVAEHLQRVSDNHEAECLYKTLGQRAGQDPAVVLRSHWEARGLDLRACRIVDGSGLSRADYISPHALARLQFLAARGPAGEAYCAVLNADRNGRVRWKLGYMSAVRTYCGLVDTETRGRLAFALMFNHFPDSAVVQRHVGEIVEAMLAL